MNSSSRNGAKVIWLAVHTTEGIMRAIDLRNWASWTGSSHASSDETGALLTPADGFVPYDQAAWTLRNGNPMSENIEQCGWARWSRAEWLARPKLLEATARWLAERSAARGIPLVRLSAADIRARRPGVIGHGDYTAATGDGTHTDPGPNYPWDVVLARANEIASGDDMPTAREVADALLDTPIERQGPGQAGTTTPRAIFQWLDAKFADVPAQVLYREIDRAGGLEGKTSLAGTIAWLDANLGDLEQKVATGDPAAAAAAIAKAVPADIAKQVADLLAQRLTA